MTPDVGRSTPAPRSPWTAWRESAAWCLAGGLAAVAPLLGWVLQTLRILCHEVGHAAMAWTFARPAVPAFDFAYGGGVTLIRDRATLLLLLVLAAWGWLAWLARGHRGALVAVGAAFAAWLAVLAFDLDEACCIAMGHGGTLVFAAVFAYRAVTGVAEHWPGERHLYGVVAWALWWQELGFAWSLLGDAAAQASYAQGKRGVDNDFVRLAGDWLGWSLEGVVVVHLLALLAAMPAITWWSARCRTVRDA